MFADLRKLARWTHATFEHIHRAARQAISTTQFQSLATAIGRTPVAPVTMPQNLAHLGFRQPLNLDAHLQTVETVIAIENFLSEKLFLGKNSTAFDKRAT
jgi:hypothetical protein